MQRAADFDPPLRVLLLDFEKAYDRVRWSFLLRGVEEREVRPKLREAVQNLLASAEATVHINGFRWHPMTAIRSVRQGCPLSSALYVLYVEHLHEMLREDTQIRGLPLLREEDLKSNSFADETETFVECLEDSVLAVREQVQLFEKYAGAKVNWKKSVVMLSEEGGEEHFADMRTVRGDQNTKYLGALLPTALTTGTQMETLLMEALMKMNRWAERTDVGVMGRVLVANNAISSTMWYVVPLSDPGKRAWREYNLGLRRYLWKNDPHILHLIYRVRWEKLTQPRKWLNCGVYRVGDLSEEEKGGWKEEEQLEMALRHQPDRSMRLARLRHTVPTNWIQRLQTNGRAEGEWVTLNLEDPPTVLFRIKVQGLEKSIPHLWLDCEPQRLFWEWWGTVGVQIPLHPGSTNHRAAVMVGQLLAGRANRPVQAYAGVVVRGALWGALGAMRGRTLREGVTLRHWFFTNLRIAVMADIQRRQNGSWQFLKDAWEHYTDLLWIGAETGQWEWSNNFVRKQEGNSTGNRSGGSTQGESYTIENEGVRTQLGGTEDTQMGCENVCEGETINGTAPEVSTEEGGADGV
ncbi:hypothetical protein CBR_g48226 [Chara braunii]|uniref:Reverse transcriptase domain-containing protein n=1 Tax=Chara braunii TaxID=69332 RepID=A0A388M296_CHABU|nr:hypothetical protein CBR_g48226 [Chara braunii]|eukprot:GBG88697.1 hypothetical protein CBR_g48226 [Chara braunii]